MSLFGKVSKVFEKLPFISLERTTPVWAGYFLNRELGRLKDEGSISQFKGRVKRIRKYRYRMELELSLTEEQVKKELLKTGKNPQNTQRR